MTALLSLLFLSTSLAILRCCSHTRRSRRSPRKVPHRKPPAIVTHPYLAAVKLAASCRILGASVTLTVATVASPARAEPRPSVFVAEGAIVTRSVLTPTQGYRGSALRITTTRGTLERARFHGAAMVLKYVTDPPDAFRGRRLEERLECVLENYRTGLPRRWSLPFSVAPSGVWTDVLAFGDARPLPADMGRVVRQELRLDGIVFAVNTIVFGSGGIDFHPLAPKHVPEVWRKLQFVRPGRLPPLP